MKATICSFTGSYPPSAKALAFGDSEFPTWGLRALDQLQHCTGKSQDLN